MNLGLMRERITTTPLSQQLPENMRDRFIMALLYVADTEEVTRTQELFRKGEADTDRGCLILEGMVRIKTEKDDKKTIEAPDILGEVQLFTPQGTRTATVEVVVGGEILTFSWKDFGHCAKSLYSPEEMQTLKKIIADSAWAREEHLRERLGLK